MPEELTDEQRAAVEALAAAIDPPSARLPGSVMTDDPRTRAVYVISVAAELAGVHPQTLRVYERKGLLDPVRTQGGSRRFSEQDLARLRHIQDLTNAGINLEGVQQVMELEAEVARLRAELATVKEEARQAVAAHPSAVPPGPGAGVPGGGGRPPAGSGGSPERSDRMTIDPNRWTVKTQEAFNAAVERAKADHHSEITPEHVLWAVLGQPDGIAAPVLSRVGVEPAVVRDRVDGQLGSAAPGVRRRGPRHQPGAARRAGGRRRAALDHGRRVPVGRAPGAGHGRPHRRRPRRPAHRPPGRPGQPPGHLAEPGGVVPGAGEVRAGPHRPGPPGEDGPGHRAGRGGPPGDPGPVPPHQEQPGADRRARRGQDGHRRGPGPADRGGRRPRGPEGQAGDRRWTWARWWPGPSTAGSSRSA